MIPLQLESVQSLPFGQDQQSLVRLTRIGQHRRRGAKRLAGMPGVEHADTLALGDIQGKHRKRIRGDVDEVTIRMSTQTEIAGGVESVESEKGAAGRVELPERSILARTERPTLDQHRQ